MRAILFCAVSALSIGCLSDDDAPALGTASTDEARAAAQAWTEAHAGGLFVDVERGDINDRIAQRCGGSGPAAMVRVDTTHVALDAQFWCDRPAGPEALYGIALRDVRLDLGVEGWSFSVVPAAQVLHAQERGLVVPESGPVTLELATRAAKLVGTDGVDEIELPFAAPLVASIEVERAAIGVFVPELR